MIALIDPEEMAELSREYRDYRDTLLRGILSSEEIANQISLQRKAIGWSPEHKREVAKELRQLAVWLMKVADREENRSNMAPTGK